MTATLDDFLPLISPFAVSAPEPLVARYLRDIITQFCERTMLWRANVQVTTDGTAPAAITSLPDSSVLHEVRECSLAILDCDNNICGATKLYPIANDELERRYPSWRTDPISCESACHYACPDFGTIQLIPRASGTMLIECALKPTSVATTFPDFVRDLYAKDIADGVAGRLLTMPEQEFSNPQLGTALYANFDARVSSLFNQGVRGQQRGHIRTRGRYF